MFQNQRATAWTDLRGQRGFLAKVMAAMRRIEPQDKKEVGQRKQMTFLQSKACLLGAISKLISIRKELLQPHPHVPPLLSLRCWGLPAFNVCFS
jgi:hypothetical protein